MKDYNIIRRLFPDLEGVSSQKPHRERIFFKGHLHGDIDRRR